MAIKIENITFGYTEKNIFEGLSFRMEEGKISGFIGKSGSGKTTMLKLLARELPNNGKIIYGSSRKKGGPRIANFMEPFPLFLHDTVREEADFYCKRFSIEETYREELLVHLLELFEEQPSFLDSRIETLSMSQKYWVTLFCLFIMDPELIIMDSVTMKLDFIYREKLIRILKILKNRYQKTIILAGNDVEFMHRVVDYFFVLHEGNLVLQGRKYDVFKEVEILKSCMVPLPKVMIFSNLVYQLTDIKMGYREEMNDLIKDIYRYVR